MIESVCSTFISMDYTFYYVSLRLTVYSKLNCVKKINSIYNLLIPSVPILSIECLFLCKAFTTKMPYYCIIGRDFQ